MKRFDELDSTTQEWALARALDDVLRMLKAILDEGLRFNDQANGDDLQARIDAAIDRADELQTPWFAAGCILDDAVVKDALESMARADAEEALYAGPDDPPVVCLAALAGGE